MLRLKHSVSKVFQITENQFRRLMLYDEDGERKHLNALERDSFYREVMKGNDLKEITFCLTLCYFGPRISEVLLTPVKRIDISEQKIVIKTLKLRGKVKFRILPIPDELLRPYEILIADRPEDEFVWSYSRTTAYRIIKRIMSNSGITGKKACPKGLRHSYAVCNIENEVPVTKLQKWLGHEFLQTTEFYLEIDGPEERKLASRIWRDDWEEHWGGYWKRSGA